MKKYLIIGLLLLTSACQTATPSPEPSQTPTATVPASPTPIPATSTSEPTLTPEPPPTPLPRFFTQRFDASLAGWVTLQAGNPAIPNISAEDGSLRLQMDSPYTWLYALYGSQEYADVYIETQFTNSALSPASAGLVCRYSEEDGWMEYNVYTDGTYSVLYGRWLDTGIADYLPILDGTSREVGQSGTRQSIGLTCSGTILRLHINGTVVRSVDVSSYKLTEGRVGLTASSFENTPIVVVFESVTVSEP
jgi:hypothetical protein